MSLPDWDIEKIREIQDGGGRALIKFWAPWCGPCQSLAPLVEAAAARHGDIEFGQVNVDEQPDVSRLFSVRGLPTMVAMEKGGVAWAQVGLVSGPMLESRLSKWA